MQLIRFRLCWILLLGLSATGCSSLSEWYACGVDCQYHPRPPLPYEQYPECVCHSHVITLPKSSVQQDMEPPINNSEAESNSTLSTQENKNENEHQSAAPDQK